MFQGCPPPFLWHLHRLVPGAKNAAKKPKEDESCCNSQRFTVKWRRCESFCRQKGPEIFTFWSLEKDRKAAIENGWNAIFKRKIKYWTNSENLDGISLCLARGFVMRWYLTRKPVNHEGQCRLLDIPLPLPIPCWVVRLRAPTPSSWQSGTSLNFSA